jgi:hypothetical protein
MQNTAVQVARRAGREYKGTGEVVPRSLFDAHETSADTLLDITRLNFALDCMHYVSEKLRMYLVPAGVPYSVQSRDLIPPIPVDQR